MTDPRQNTESREESVSAGPDSVLGKYYTHLALYEYERENPFSTGPDANQAIASGIIRLPLPVQLYDRTSSAFSQQNLGIIGDIFNLDPGGINAAPLRLLETLGPGALAAVTQFFSSKVGGFSTPVGRLVGSVGQNIDVSAISTSVQQVLGLTPNPNPVVAFKGPQLRNFNYTWYLAPKNQKESDNIELIIKKLKAAALPGKAVSSNALLKLPKLVQMNFYPWDTNGASNSWGWHKENSIIRMKRCHISNVSVNYNPANVPSFFYDNSPVIMELSIELLEVEYLFNNEWYDGFPVDQSKDIYNLKGISNALNLGLADIISDF